MAWPDDAVTRAALPKTQVPGGGGKENFPTIGTVADPYGNLDGANRDAAIALTALFKSYGLDSLAPQIIKMIQNGFSADTIALLLQDTKEYKTRFAANDARIKAGLPVLSPAEYISTEQAYRQVMSAAGLPIGFYDSTSDFRKFLEGDVSPTEVKSRVDAVSEAIYRAPQATKDIFSQWYSTGDMIAYALDPKVASPLIEQRIRAAEAAAVARQQGLTLSQMSAERLGVTGSTLSEIEQGFSFIAQEKPTTDKLSALYGGALSQDDLVAEVFDKDANATLKRRGLASRERGVFAGSSGQAKGSLGKESTV
jgi:transcriptional regulator with XRE-family HTH domain